MNKQENGVSADLPYELQSKMFDQLAAISLGGAGLTVTLIGSILKDAPGIVWLSVVEFGAAALICITANIGLIESLFEQKDRRKQSKWMTALAVTLIGMGTGSLAMSIYHDGRDAQSHLPKPTATGQAR